MINLMLGVVGTVGLVVGAVVVTAVFTYLFLAANKNKKAAIDAAVEKIKAELKK
jgi:hypothetical protein